MCRESLLVPTVAIIEGYRFFFFSNEGTEPAHIHVEKGDGYGKIWLSPVHFAGTSGFSPAQLRRVREITAQNRDLFLEKWHEFFGHG